MRKKNDMEYINNLTQRKVEHRPLAKVMLARILSKRKLTIATSFIFFMPYH